MMNVNSKGLSYQRNKVSSKQYNDQEGMIRKFLFTTSNHHNMKQLAIISFF